MKIAAYAGNPDVAMVYVGEFEDERLVEFVEAIQPPKTIDDKWVLMISILYGCPVKCNMCDAGGFYHGKVAKEKIFEQIDYLVDKKFTDRKISSEQFKIQFARMGDPIFNETVFDFAEWLYTDKKELPLKVEVVHPVLTTSLPRGYKHLEDRLMRWCSIKNDLYNGQAGLQFSINSTDEDQRTEMFGDRQTYLEDFAKIADKFPDPVSRKYCLNFAYATDFKIDAQKIRSLFDPEKFMIKITPIHNNNACEENGIVTVDGYESYAPYQPVEEAFKDAGFDVLVFVPSIDEEDGLVTCGNVILGGSVLKNSTDIIKIEGLAA